MLLNNIYKSNKYKLYINLIEYEFNTIFISLFNKMKSNISYTLDNFYNINIRNSYYKLYNNELCNILLIYFNNNDEYYQNICILYFNIIINMCSNVSDYYKDKKNIICDFLNIIVKSIDINTDTNKLLLIKIIGKYFISFIKSSNNVINIKIENHPVIIKYNVDNYKEININEPLDFFESNILVNMLLDFYNILLINNKILDKNIKLLEIKNYNYMVTDNAIVYYEEKNAYSIAEISNGYVFGFNFKEILYNNNTKEYYTRQRLYDKPGVLYDIEKINKKDIKTIYQKLLQLLFIRRTITEYIRLHTRFSFNKNNIFPLGAIHKISRINLIDYINNFFI